MRNLASEPRCTVEVAGRKYIGNARILTAATDEDELARTLVFDKYSRDFGDLVAWRAEALPVAIDLHEE